MCDRNDELASWRRDALFRGGGGKLSMMGLVTLNCRSSLRARRPMDALEESCELLEMGDWAVTTAPPERLQNQAQRDLVV